MKRFEGLAVVLAVILFSGLAHAGWFSPDNILKLRKYLTIGTSTKDGALTVKGDGTADIANFQDSTGTEIGVFDADGDFTAKTITSSGATTPASVTADPCTGTGYGPGAMFYNSTSGYMCFCDGSTDDIKMNDNTTACF